MYLSWNLFSDLLRTKISNEKWQVWEGKLYMSQKKYSGSHKKRTFDSKNNLENHSKSYSLRRWLCSEMEPETPTHSCCLRITLNWRKKRCKIHPGSTEIMIHIWNTKISMAITHLYHMAFSSQLSKCFLQNKIQTQDCNKYD